MTPFAQVLDTLGSPAHILSKPAFSYLYVFKELCDARTTSRQMKKISVFSKMLPYFHHNPAFHGQDYLTPINRKSHFGVYQNTCWEPYWWLFRPCSLHFSPCLTGPFFSSCSAYQGSSCPIFFGSGISEDTLGRSTSHIDQHNSGSSVLSFSPCSELKRRLNRQITTF